MHDLISRKTLLKAMDNVEELMKEAMCIPSWATAKECIRTVKPVDRWIPCSERMPEDESVPYWTTHEDGSIVMHWYSKECGFTFNWEVDDLEKRKRQGRVIAWMSILQPEPYKAGDIDG